MDSDTTNLVRHIKRLVYSSIRLGYQSACDYPIVLGAGILLLFLHRLCPSLFAFLLSSSPVFLLTALLLGALLSCGEHTVPMVGEDTLENQQTLSLKSNIGIADCSIEEVETVTVEACSEKRTDSGEAYVRERASDDNMHDINCEEKIVAYMSSDTVLSKEVYVKEKASNDNLHDTHREGKNTTSMATNSALCVESSNFAKSNVIVEREDHVGINSKKVELQEFESTNPENGNSEVQNQYQLGEFMSSCWQPVIRQDPCSDSESDLTESSSPDASMADIIPMLEELHPLIELGTGHPSLAVRDNLNSLSDDNEDDLEEEVDVSSDEEDGVEGQKDDGNNWKDVIDLNSLDMEKNSRLESLMELQRAKNILKFELDKRLMDLRAADATQKLKEASRFHVQVPSISAPRSNPFDPSNVSEEMIELPQIPDSAPSVLFPRRNLFDLPFDQIVDHDSQSPETWTPRSYFPATQHRKHRNLYGQHSTYLQHHNGIKLERGEISGKDACDSHSNNDAEQEGNNGKLFGSLEVHIGENIKILSAAISDVGVSEVSYGMDEGNKNADFSDDINSFPIMKSISSTLEVKDSDHAGSKQSILCSLSIVNNSEPHIVEADSIGEVNSLFKCRMEEVLLQSISEHSIGQLLMIKLEDELSDRLSSDPGMHVIEASSVEELNSQFARLNEEPLTCAASDSTCHNESIQDRSSEALPAVNEHNSELSIEVGSTEMLTSRGDQQTADSSEFQVIEARSIEDINSFIKQHYEEAQNNDTLESPVQIVQKSTTDQFSSDPEQPGYLSELHVLEASSVEDLTAAFKKLHGEVEIRSASDLTTKLEDNSSSELHVVKASSVEEETSLAKQLDGKSQMETISDSAIHEPTAVKLEGKPSEPLTKDGELPVPEASSVEEMNSLFKQLEEEVQSQMPQSSEHKFGQYKEESASDILALEAKSIEVISSASGQLGIGEVDPVELKSGLQVTESKTLDDDTSDSGFKVTELKISAEKAESTVIEGQPAEDI